MARPKGSTNKPKDSGPTLHPSNHGRGKKPPKPPKATKAAKPAAPGIGHNSDDAAGKELYRAYRDKLRPLLNRLEKAKKDVAEVYADAKRDKIKKKAFAVGDKLLSQNKKAEKGVLDDIALTLWVADAIGHEMAKQQDLFAYVNDADAGGAPISAEAEGAQAFRDGQPFKPPYAETTEKHAEFSAGYYGAQEKAVRKGIKPLEPTGKPAHDDTDWGDADPARPLN